MNIKNFLLSASIGGAALLLMAANAGATTVTFNTNDSATGFGGTSLILNSTGGAAATLTFIPDADTATGVPSNVNFGNFTLVCPTCPLQGMGTGASFGAFTFDLVITDVTDGGAQGKFVGTSAGGTVYSNVSPIVVNWAPLQLGPGNNNASFGDFGTTIFATSVFTGIVAPNSGEVNGQSTIQGFVDSNPAPVPEPATFGLAGAALIALGLLRHKKYSRE